jgi:serine/threonine-protein kinase HipA
MDNHRFYVGWQAKHIGTLEYDGETFTFDYQDGWLLPMTLAKNLKPRAIPSSITSMMPEGFRSDAMFGPEGAPLFETLSRSERFMSNVVIVDDPDKIAKIPLDRLYGRLKNFTNDSTFSGRVQRVPRIVGVFIAQLQELVSRRTMPMMSGFHAKIPMFLDEDGIMSPAELMPFTHILKVPGLHGDQEYARSMIEWACMDIARAGGLTIAECALVELGDNKIGMVSERFDICRDEDDMRLLFAEEFHAVLGKGAASHLKFNSTTSVIATRMREVSTNFSDDSREFLRLVAANLLLENGDFHLKNLSMLKVAEPTLTGFRHVRLAPAYDIMNTRKFTTQPQPELADEIQSMVFKINGKDTDITAQDLVAFAKSMDIEADEAMEIITDLAAGMIARARALYETPPALIARDSSKADLLRWTCGRLAKRVGDLFPEMDCALGDTPESTVARRSRP